MDQKLQDQKSEYDKKIVELNERIKEQGEDENDVFSLIIEETTWSGWNGGSSENKDYEFEIIKSGKLSQKFSMDYEFTVGSFDKDSITIIANNSLSSMSDDGINLGSKINKFDLGFNEEVSYSSPTMDMGVTFKFKYTK